MFKIFMLASFTLVSAFVQAAEVVVIRSSEPLLSVGKIIAADESVQVSAEREITVVFATGKVRTVRGEFQGRIASDEMEQQGDPTLVPALAKFLQQTQKSVLRAASVEEKPRDIWVVDLSNNSRRHYCVDKADVILWRPNSQTKLPSTLLLKHKESGKESSLSWPAYSSTVAWPASLPVVFGDTYAAELNTVRGQTNFKKVVIYQVPSLPTSSHKVVWMVSHGCVPQANMLLAEIR